MIELSKYKLLVLDIGNVVIDIDYKLTISELEKLGIDFSHPAISHLLESIETGAIEADDFIAEFQDIFDLDEEDDSTDKQALIKIFNALIMEIDPKRIQEINKLRDKIRVVALSNTNEIHVRCINSKLKNLNLDGVRCLETLFDKLYLSHELGFRKPGQNIYEYLLKKENMSANQVLYFDDDFNNVQSAKGLEIDAVQIKDSPFYTLIQYNLFD